MPHVEIKSDVTLRLRAPVAKEILEGRRDEAREASHVAKRKRIRYTPPSDTEMYGPEIVLCQGVTEVTDEVASYIDTVKATGALRNVTVIRNAAVAARRAAHVPAREPAKNPEILTPGAVKHGTAEWARMEAERLAAEAQDGLAAPRQVDPDADLPVYGCPGCPEGASEFPSQAALDRHWQIHHGDDALPEGTPEADTATASADTVPAPTNEPPSGEEF